MSESRPEDSPVDKQPAADLLPEVYAELRRLAASLSRRLQPGQTFAAGSKQIVSLSFRPANSFAGNATISFGDQPVPRGVADLSAVALAANRAAHLGCRHDADRCRARGVGAIG